MKGNVKQFIRYVIVGCLTTIIGWTVYYVCLNTVLTASVPWQLQLANIVSWVIGAAFSFEASRLYVFKPTSTVRMKQAARFAVPRIVELSVENAELYAFVSLMGENAFLVKILISGVTVFLNFCLSKYWIFCINK